MQHLKAHHYRFVTPTPKTHGRWLERAEGRIARTTAEVLGWNLPFVSGTIEPTVERLLHRTKALADCSDGLLRATLRVSSLGAHLFVHSGFPTEEHDAVFFGPDSYRFGNLIAGELAARPAPAGARIADMGIGTGVGAIVAAEYVPAPRLFGTDVNPAALRIAACNLHVADVRADLVLGQGLAGIDGGFDLILANPPYLVDEGLRTYRHGGGRRGAETSLDFAASGISNLAPAGRMILYTGSAIAGGQDDLRNDLERMASERDVNLRYWEIDPDVFGEELERRAYADTDRIAAVAAILSR